MVKKKIHHIGAQEGYDRWSETYDQTANPIVSMDNRYTPRFFTPKLGERILDAGCGTGRHFALMLKSGSQVFGIDFAPGMLQIAHRKYPQVPVILADLQKPLPVRSESFDAVLCALVGEHLKDLHAFFRETHGILRAGGRLLFSVYHPEMAVAGKEAQFQRKGIEFRLGAYRHTIQDYLNTLDEVGFDDLDKHEFQGDEKLIAEIPEAEKYSDFPMLLLVQAKKRKLC